MALMKQEEEEKLPHKRKRKGKGDKGDEEDNSHLDYSAPDRDLSTLSTSRGKYILCAYSVQIINIFLT